MTLKSNSNPMVPGVRIAVLTLLMAFGFALTAGAQSFSSGSDGSDGPLDAASLGVTTTPATVIFNPASFPGDQHSLNIFNFTTIDIPAGVTVKLSSANINGPVIWLASGEVNVESGATVDLSGQPGVPISPNLDGRRRSVAGAGGYDGGVGGEFDGSATNANEPLALPGDGPGGGAAGKPELNCNFMPLGAEPGLGGSYSGSVFLVPLIGGSGGGGGLFPGNLGSVPFGAGGGAGGGALLIASSTTINVNGTINANGGAGGKSGGAENPSDCNYQAWGYGGGGSGGGIRLAANSIAGSGTLTAAGGASSTSCGGFCNPNSGGNGVVRLEAFTESFSGTVTGTESPGSPYGTFVPSSSPPSISVVSVGTSTLPSVPTGSLTAPDAQIQTSSAVTITVQTTNIPVGTILTLSVFSDNNTQQSVKTTPLVATGTTGQAQATATVTFPSGYALNYVKATWTTSN